MPTMAATNTRRARRSMPMRPPCGLLWPASRHFSGRVMALCPSLTMVSDVEQDHQHGERQAMAIERRAPPAALLLGQADAVVGHSSSGSRSCGRRRQRSASSSEEQEQIEDREARTAAAPAHAASSASHAGDVPGERDEDRAEQRRRRRRRAARQAEAGGRDAGDGQEHRVDEDLALGRGERRRRPAASARRRGRSRRCVERQRPEVRRRPQEDDRGRGGSSEATPPVTAAQPITGGSAPAAPPMTMFCGVERFSHIV